MQQKRLVIFDVDGTLFQTDCVTVPAVQRTYAQYGLPVPDRETIIGFFGKSVASYEHWLTQQCPPDLASEVLVATNELELRLIGAEGRLYPGVVATLEQLHADGYTLAVCSNGPNSYVNEVVDAHQLRRFFPVVYARDKHFSGKREMVGRILEEVAPAIFAVIGDRSDDIEAAHTWNGFGIAATYGFGGTEEHRNADATIDAITKSPDALNRLFQYRDECRTTG